MLKTKEKRSLRKTLVKRKNDWIEIPFYDLSEGDQFQLFEPNGKRVLNHCGEYIFQAISKPYFCEELEAWTVDIDEKNNESNNESNNDEKEKTE